MNRTLLLAAAGLVSLAGALPAQAAIVNYDFVVSVDSGPLAGHSYNGKFGYDDAQAPGTNPFGDTTFVLSSFDFTFDGHGYSLADFGAPDALLWTLPDGEKPGLDGAQAEIGFVPGFGGDDPAFAYDKGAGVAGFGAIVYSVHVAEPSSAALMAVALLGLSLGARRRQRRGVRWEINPPA
ncbi:MAG: PEP-CTERM sorting domain-containing protein [Burkholderiales bacterium]|nr:PEP-CTERM sorting domain-containing protein [Burkholderiales bacterium]